MKLQQTNYQEDEISKEYLIGDSCLINNFEFKDTRNDEMKSLEFISDTNSAICLYGFLQKHPKNTTNSFFVKILNIKQWSFSESGDIIVQSSRYWYKLLNPSPEYAPTFELFEQRNNLWKGLKPFLMDWMKNLTKCNNEEELNINKNTLTLESILQNLPNTSENSMLEHAQFLYETILQDRNLLLDDSQENQLITTPFVNFLKENQYKKKETQMIKVTKETALMDGIDVSDSFDSLDEKEFDDTEEDETEDYSEPNESNSKRRKSKKQITPGKKKTEGKKRRTMKQVYKTAHKMEQGIPSMDYFLKQEFSPRLLTELSVKYEPGICHSSCFQCRRRRISCYKERPLCSNCLHEGYECEYPELLRLSPCVPCGERGGKVCNRGKPCDVCLERGTNCYYFTSDTFLILAEKNINSTKEQNEETGKTNITSWNDEAYCEILKEMDEKIKKYDQKQAKTPKPQLAPLEDLAELEKQAEVWKSKAQKEKKTRMEIREKLESFIGNLENLL